jgi:hypothetical protein
VDRFALTSNNVSYHLTGEALGYWGFFPAEAGWARTPAMGYATVLDSAHARVAVGERVWGFFPMGTHLRVQAGRVQADSFSDVSPHRAAFAPIYAQFQRAAANPWYEPAREDHDLLLRGLHFTGWLLEDFLHDNAHFGARAALVTSASSKTAIAFATCARERGALELIGLTSARNTGFVRRLGLYDRVLGYEALETLDAGVPALLTDFAGNAALTGALHRHYGESLRHSASIGATHHAAAGPTGELPGVQPQFFFAPAQIQKRAAEWGPGAVEQRIGRHFAAFRRASDAWLELRHSRGAEACASAWQRVLAGAAGPAEGHILSLGSDNQ